MKLKQVRIVERPWDNGDFRWHVQARWLWWPFWTDVGAAGKHRDEDAARRTALKIAFPATVMIDEGQRMGEMLVPSAPADDDENAAAKSSLTMPLAGMTPASLQKYYEQRKLMTQRLGHDPFDRAFDRIVTKLEGRIQ